MSRRNFAALAGWGEVFFESESLGPARYHLNIYQAEDEWVEYKPHFDAGSLTQIEGSVRGGSLPAGEMLKLVTCQEHFQLYFFVADSHAGTITVTALLNAENESLV